MTISEIMTKMIAYSEGNLHDINHFIKVYTYAKTIGECEGLDAHTQFLLEAAAIVHDIACPLCRTKYGNTNGKYQEQEGMILTRAFFEGTALPATDLDRIVYLVGHHHTLTNINGADYQILLEADYLVNADESGFSNENKSSALAHLFSTKTGISLLKSIYQLS